MFLNILESGLVCSLLLVTSFIDIRKNKIPNWTVWALFGVWLAFAFLRRSFWQLLLKQLITAIIVAVVLTLVAVTCDKLLKKKSLGGGDIKLFFTISLFSNGWQMLYVVFVFCIVAILETAIFWFTRKKLEFIPLAPTIAVATLLIFLLSDLNVQI